MKIGFAPTIVLVHLGHPETGLDYVEVTGVQVVWKMVSRGYCETAGEDSPLRDEEQHIRISAWIYV